MNNEIETDYENKLDKEIENRIKVMESTDYSFAKRFSKIDYTITGLVVFICIVILIAGAYL
jgi:lipopolysaccharide/colanic/teichoic acid biosynthesis glycosyltransferase